MPYRWLPARSDAPPVLLSCEHASAELPAFLPAWEAWPHWAHTHWAVDIGAGPLTESIHHRLGCAALLGRYSRLYLDLNRDPEAQDLCRTSFEGVAVPFNAAVSSAERNRRVAEVHAPYFRSGRAWVRNRQPRLVLSVHSFTPSLAQQDRPWALTVLFNRSDALAENLAQHLSEAVRVKVALNQPYSGKQGFVRAAERLAEPAASDAIVLEVRQDLAADQPWRDRIAGALMPWLRALTPAKP